MSVVWVEIDPNVRIYPCVVKMKSRVSESCCGMVEIVQSWKMIREKPEWLKTERGFSARKCWWGCTSYFNRKVKWKILRKRWYTDNSRPVMGTSWRTIWRVRLQLALFVVKFTNRMGGRSKKGCLMSFVSSSFCWRCNPPKRDRGWELKVDSTEIWMSWRNFQQEELVEVLKW